GVAVVQRAVLLGAGQEGVEDGAGGQRGRQRQVAAGQALGHAHEVGLDALVLAGEQAARPAEAGGHLVDDQQHAVTAGDVTEAAPFSEKNTRSSEPGASATRRAASSMAGGCERPRNVEWASRPSWSTMAASMAPTP